MARYPNQTSDPINLAPRPTKAPPRHAKDVPGLSTAHRRSGPLVAHRRSRRGGSAHAWTRFSAVTGNASTCMHERRSLRLVSAPGANLHRTKAPRHAKGVLKTVVSPEASRYRPARTCLYATRIRPRPKVIARPLKHPPRPARATRPTALCNPLPNRPHSATRRAASHPVALKRTLTKD